MFSKTANYGIRATAYLAAQSERRCGAKEIAEHARIPANFLRKILSDLTRHEILKSAKGIHGGYQLARPATTITLWDIAELLDATLNCEAFLADSASRSSAAGSVDDELSKVRQQVIELLGSKTVWQISGQAELARRAGM